MGKPLNLDTDASAEICDKCDKGTTSYHQILVDGSMRRRTRESILHFLE